MSSEIRTNLLKSRTGLSTVTLSDTGPVVTGIATFGVTTKIDGGNNVINVGTALTIGHTQGVQFHTQNLHSTGFEVNQVNASGIITASSYRGDGSQLTGISAGFSPDAQGNLVAGTNAGANFSGTDPVHNILIGYEAGNALTTADYSVAIGYHALKSADTESYNVAIGYNALKELTGMGGNVAVGYQAGYYTYNMYECVAVGYNAMSKPVQSGNTWYSVAVGANAMGACGGDRCTAVGHEALDGNNASTADDNTAIGHQSLTNLLSNGLKNTAVGTFSGKATTSGDENVYIGYNAGNDAHTTGSNCIIIGTNAAASGASVSNEVSIGNTSITKFRIPGIDFVLKDNGGTPTQGHVLTVDGSGEAGFAAPAGGVTINNNANTRVVTASGNANEFDAQASLTFSTSNNDPKLTITGTGHAQLNLTSTGGTDHTGINFGDSADINAGMIQYSNTGDSMQFHTNGSEKVRITSAGTVNIGDSSTQTTHMLHLQSDGDAGIHIRADVNNSGENDNPYLSMSQDGAAAAQFQIGMNGDAGQHFTTSLANAAYIYASNSSSQPIQIAHMDNMCVNIAARKNEIALNDYNGNTIAGMEIHHYGNDTGAALKFSGHNNTGTPGLKTFTQLTHLGGDAKFMIHHMGSTALQIGSTRRIDVPAVYGTAISSPMRDLYVESTGQLGYDPSIRASKINIADNTDVSWLYNLAPKTYNKRKRVSRETNEWTNEAEPDLQYGLIAEEVESVNSNICFYDVDESNNKTLAGVTYSQLITPILKAVQDLKSEIHSLQEENKALRIRVTNLEDN